MAEQVRTMFARIARRYDRTNSVLSWGRHHAWRRRAVELAQPPRGGSVLDVATGTGDLALEFRRQVGPKGRVVGVDFCAPMLDVARVKAERQGLAAEFHEGDALRLNFPDGVFDVASIGFGIRNVDDPGQCLEEMARVVRPGGRVVVLEFGQPDGVIRWPYAYSRVVIPVVGGLLTGQRDAYDYLRRTSATFPSGDEFLELMHSTGRFVDARATPLTGGIAFAYVGVVASHVKAPN
jgi:demethylmenaquinone methyltransferase / 2-methoxy-6-polyprenyl-1,4-benzoquinol methylase